MGLKATEIIQQTGRLQIVGKPEHQITGDIFMLTQYLFIYPELYKIYIYISSFPHTCVSLMLCNKLHLNAQLAKLYIVLSKILTDKNEKLQKLAFSY